MDTELCPNCGREVSELDEFTGWCESCTTDSNQAWFGSSTSTTSSYLQANADKLEHYIAQGHSLEQTIDLLADAKNGHRPTCIVCGSVIKHAPRTSVFCRKNKECRRFSRRYVYLYTKRGLTKTEALAQILSEVT